MKFKSEKEMQEWLSNRLESVDGLAEILANLEEIQEYETEDASCATIVASFRKCIESLHDTHVVSQDENISCVAGDILRPDFVLYAPETESIVLVELKNAAGPTREAGTEIAAYASEIRASIPFISDGDLIGVIISPHWPCLLKHYVRQEILWAGRNLICLRPKEVDGETMLSILSPDELREGGLDFRVPPEYLGGYQICLYDDELYHDRTDRSRLDKYEQQFRTALDCMASTGSRINSHGFAFLWRDKWQHSLAPWSITVINFAPFQTVERFLHDKDGLRPLLFDKLHEVIVEYSPEGHGNALAEVANSANPFLSAVCKPRYEGFSTWRSHQEILNQRADMVAFVAWGRFEKSYFDRLSREYNAGNFGVSSTDPIIGLEVVLDLIEVNYEFIDLSQIPRFDKDELDIDEFKD